MIETTTSMLQEFKRRFTAFHSIVTHQHTYSLYTLALIILLRSKRKRERKAKVGGKAKNVPLTSAESNSSPRSNSTYPPPFCAIR